MRVLEVCRVGSWVALSVVFSGLWLGNPAAARAGTIYTIAPGSSLTFTGPSGLFPGFFEPGTSPGVPQFYPVTFDVDGSLQLTPKPYVVGVSRTFTVDVYNLSADADRDGSANGVDDYVFEATPLKPIINLLTGNQISDTPGGDPVITTLPDGTWTMYGMYAEYSGSGLYGTEGDPGTPGSRG
jgi:hypothetical protein